MVGLVAGFEHAIAVGLDSHAELDVLVQRQVQLLERFAHGAESTNTFHSHVVATSTLLSDLLVSPAFADCLAAEDGLGGCVVDLAGLVVELGAADVAEAASLTGDGVVEASGGRSDPEA